MDEQVTYASFLSRYHDIVSSNLVPKTALYDCIRRRFNNDYDNLIGAAPLFYYFQQSLELDVFLTLAKLLDGKRSDRNILRFLDYCEANRKKIQWKNGPLPFDVVSKHKSEILKHQEIIGKITARRDKFLAHSDKEYFLDQQRLDVDYPINMTEVIELIRCFQRILGDHSHGLNESGVISVDGFFYIAADNLLNDILKAKFADLPQHSSGSGVT